MRRVVLGLVVLIAIGSGALVINAMSDSPEKGASEWAQALRHGDQSRLAARTCAARQKAIPVLAKLGDLGVYSVGTVKPEQLVRRISEVGPTFRVERLNGSIAWLRPSGEYRYRVKSGSMEYEPTFKVDAPWKMKREGTLLPRWKWCGDNAVDTAVSIGFLPRDLLAGQRPVVEEYKPVS